MKRYLITALYKVLGLTEDETKKFIKDHNGKPTQEDLEKYVEDQGLDKTAIEELMYDLSKNQVVNLTAPEPAPPRPPAKVSDKMLEQYIESITFTERADNSGSDDTSMRDSNMDRADFAEEAIKKAKKDLEDFVKKAGSLIDDIDDTDVAHDFWLTRNHHGAGFWDRGHEGTLGDDLTEIAESFPEQSAYIGDDGQIYID